MNRQVQFATVGADSFPRNHTTFTDRLDGHGLGHGHGHGWVNESSLDWLPYIQLNARHLQTLNGYVVLAISTALNTMLLTVMALEKNETLKTYSTALRLNCIVDLYYTYVAVIVDFQTDISDGHAAYALGGIFPRLSQFWNYVGIVAYLSGLCSSIFVIPIIFYYRYNLIVKRVQLSVGRLWLAIVASFAIACFIGFEIVLADMYDTCTSSCEEIFAHPLWTHGGYTVSNCLISSRDNVFLWLHIASIAGINFVVYSFMFYYTFGIFRALKEHEAQYNQRTSKIQRQMNILLMIQLALPFLCGSVPITIIFTLIPLHYTVVGMGNVVMGMMEWIPLINPLVTILLVTNYRQRVWQLLRCRTSRAKDFGTTQVSVEPSSRRLTIIL